MDVDEVLGRARELCRGGGLPAVARLKEEVPARRAIGYLPIYAPREIIDAAGMLPVGVMGDGDLEIIRGDAYFQSYICHLPRSVIELAISRRMDSLDGMVFPAICDVVRNLSGMWQILFPDRYTRYLDLPQNFDPEVGGRFYRQDLVSLAEDLARVAGTELSLVSLRQSIVRYNENRASLTELDRQRDARPWLFPASEAYQVVRAGHVLPVERHTALVREYIAAAGSRSSRPLDHIRVVVVGAFCEQPPLEMIQTIERAGCYIVQDDFLVGSRWIQGDVDPGIDPFDALVRAYLAQSVRSPSRYDADSGNGRALVDLVRRSRAEGVVFCSPSFCDPSLLEQPLLAAAMEEAGIPFTTFKYSENTGQFQVIREQTGTFSDSIRLWGSP